MVILVVSVENKSGCGSHHKPREVLHSLEGKLLINCVSGAIFQAWTDKGSKQGSFNISCGKVV